MQGLQGRIDALEGALQQARAEVSELRGQLSGVHAELASLKTPVRVEQAQREALADRVVALEAAGDSQDRAARANNLVVKGLPEGGSNEDTGSAIRSLLPSVTAGQVLEASAWVHHGQVPHTHARFSCGSPVRRANMQP